MEKDKFYIEFEYNQTMHYIFAKKESAIFQWIYYLLESKLQFDLLSHYQQEIKVESDTYAEL
jgi:hypothetical protein